MGINVVIDHIPEGCGGGYADIEENTIHLDVTYPPEQWRLIAVHEVIELHLKRIKHSKIDQMAIDIIDVLDNLKEKME